MTNRYLVLILAAACLYVGPIAAQQNAQQQQSPQQRVAQLKAWLQASQQQLRHYEWVETMTLTKDDEVKATKQNQVYYGADGQLQKVPVDSGNDESAGGPPGLLPVGRMAKRRAKHEKEELEEYLKASAALFQSYIPTDANMIQQSIDSGNFGVNVIRPGQEIRVDFHNYKKANDTLSIKIELPTNRLTAMAISSYLEDSPKDVVRLDVTMGLLPDGTIFAANTRLNAPEKEVVVEIANTGYRKMGSEQ